MQSFGPASTAAPQTDERPVDVSRTSEDAQPTTARNTKKERSSRERFQFFPVGAGITFAVFSVVILSASGLTFAGLLDKDAFVLAPVQIVLGSIAFLATITAIVTVFARLGLYDRTKALGLPAGSVRALIALILLIIFVIFANVVYGSLSVGGSTTSFTGLSAEQVEDLPGVVLEQEPGAEEDTFDGTVRLAVSDDATALGQQIVTALITLVAAVSAFYFGTSSLESAARTLGPGSEPTPKELRVLQPGSPATIVRTADGTRYEPVAVKLGGSALEDEAATASVAGDEPGTVLASPTEAGTFVYTAVQPTSPVTLSFTSAGATASLTLRVPETTEPPPPPGGPPPAGGSVVVDEAGGAGGTPRAEDGGGPGDDTTGQPEGDDDR